MGKLRRPAGTPSTSGSSQGGGGTGSDVQDLYGNEALKEMTAGVHIATAPGEGGSGYEGKNGYADKPFTEDEEQWIQDVLEMPGIQTVLAGNQMPEVVLHRVDATKDNGDDGHASGQFTRSVNHIAITDTNADQVQACFDSTAEECESYEHAFKQTLIHELFHFFSDEAEALTDLVAPRGLVDALLQPGLCGEPQFTFGWFHHPVVGQAHFQEGGKFFDILSEGSELSLVGTKLAEVYKDTSLWERSPMPESGGSVSPEEDMAESFSLYLMDPKVMKAVYPKRHELIDQWLGGLYDALNEY